MASSVTLQYAIVMGLTPEQQSGMADSFTISDSIAFAVTNLMEIDNQLSDFLVLSDVLASDSGIQTIDPDDVMSQLDATAFIEGTLSQFSDAIIWSDSVSHSDSRTNLSLVETLVAQADSFIATQGILALVASDGLSLSDAATVASGAETLATSDALTQSDVGVLLLNSFASFTETLVQTDSATVTELVALLSLTPAEALSQVDTPALVMNSFSSLADELVQLDSLSISDGENFLSFSEAMFTMADVFAPTLGIVTLTLAETMTQSDAAPMTLLEKIALSDSLTQSDAITVLPLSAVSQLAVSDALTLSDNVVVATNLTITTSSLPEAAVGEAYSATLAAQGGVPPYTWSLVAPQLIASATGSGTVAAWYDRANLVLKGQGSLIQLEDSLRNYNDSFAASFSLLPPGITLASNGTLSGTPTGAGTFNFTVQVADSSGMMMMLFVRMDL